MHRCICTTHHIHVSARTCAQLTQEVRGSVCTHMCTHNSLGTTEVHAWVHVYVDACVVLTQVHMHAHTQLTQGSMCMHTQLSVFRCARVHTHREPTEPLL
jgi:hypothetical protein